MRWGASWDVAFGYGKRRWSTCIFFSPRMRQTLKGQEAVGCDTQRRMMVEAGPTSTLELIQADLLLEHLVVTLYPPSHLRDRHQALERARGRERGKKILRRLQQSRLPFDQQPLIGTQRLSCSFVGRTRIRANHECSGAFVPCSQVT